MNAKRAIAHWKDVPDHEPYAVVVDGIPLVIVKEGGTCHVLEGRCLHQGTLLADGHLEKGYLVCPAHQWQFRVATGQKKADHSVCLQRFETSVAGGKVCIDGSAFEQWKVRKATANVPKQAPGAQPTIQELPGPAGVPLLGHATQLSGSKVHQTLEKWSRRFGSMYKIHIGARPVVVISDIRMTQTLMKNRPDHIRRFSKIEEVVEEMGLNGVFTAEGENWKRQRKFTMQALSNRHLRQFFPTIQQVTHRLEKRWYQAANSDQTTDIQKDLMRFTVDVTTQLAFGYEMNTLEQEKDVIQDHLEKIFPKLQSRIVAPFPYWRYMKLPSDRKLDQALKVIETVIHEYIAAARKRIADHPELKNAPTNFLEALLVAQNDDGSSFSDREIYANVFTMLLAGEDTTAHSIAWIAYFMTQYPEVQANMQQEADEVLGDQTILQDYDQAHRFPYTEAVVHESMRLKPVAPMLFLEVLKDTEVGGLLLPAGTTVFSLSRQATQQEANFPAPKEFIPERWLPGHDYYRKMSHDAFIPFGYGPRLCPGRSLAFLEIKTVVAMLCRNFHLSHPAQAKPVDEHMAFTMCARHLLVKFSRRPASPWP